MIPSVITERQSQLETLCQEHHVRRLELFGSATTDAWDPGRSDLDFLVKFEPDSRFADHYELEQALRQLFERDIDLVADMEFKNPYFRQSVEDTRTHLWGEQRQVNPGNGVRVSSHRALKYLWDVRQETDYLLAETAGMSGDELSESETLSRAVLMSLITIGEALNGLSRRDKATTERISNYRRYVDQRNILVHQYRKIDWDKVWRTVTQDAPLLAREVDALIAELESGAE